VCALCSRFLSEDIFKFFNSTLTFSLFLSFSLSLCASAFGSGQCRTVRRSFCQFEITVQRIHRHYEIFESSSPNEIRQTRKEEESVDFTRALRRRSLSLFLSEVILLHRRRARVELAQILLSITVQENSDSQNHDSSIFLPSLPKCELIKGLHFLFNQSQGTERS